MVSNSSFCLWTNRVLSSCRCALCARKSQFSRRNRLASRINCDVA